MKWIRLLLRKLQSGHDSVHRRADRRTDGRTDGQTDGQRETSIPSFQLRWSRGIMKFTNTTRTTRTPAFWGYPPAASMITHTIESCWIPQVKTRSNDLEDIGQGQRSWHATHLLMLVIICTKYGKNPCRTVDATEQTRFSRSRPNDLENIGQGQRSLHATHPLMLMMICAKYGKNPSKTVDFFFKVKTENFKKIAKNSNF